MNLDEVIPNPHHRMGHSRSVGAPRTVVVRMIGGRGF